MNGRPRSILVAAAALAVAVATPAGAGSPEETALAAESSIPGLYAVSALVDGIDTMPSMALDPDTGFLWVSHGDDDVVVGYDHAGNVVESFGVPDSGPGQIAISDGEIYVTENWFHRVHVFDTQGNTLRMWGSEGGGAGQFVGPCGIVVVGNRAFVADQGAGRVQIFNTSNGAYIDSFGSLGNGDGQLAGNNCGGDMLSHYGGEIFVADLINARIAVFDVDGNWQRNFGSGTLSAPLGIDATTGTVWLTDHGEDTVSLWTPNGALVDSFGATGGALGTLNGPAAIAVDPNAQTVWVSELNNDRVQVFTTHECAGESLTHVGTSYGDTFTTTGNADVVWVGPGRDIVNLGGGHDTACGGGGVDTIRGGFGSDLIKGGAGNDRLFGGGGADTLKGDAGNDKMWGGTGPDLLSGGLGADEAHGQDGNDTVNGLAGNDALYGEKGADKLNGGDGKDDAFGGGGKDTIKGNKGADHLRGNAGDDALFGGAATDICKGNAGIDTAAGCETVFGVP